METVEKIDSYTAKITVSNVIEKDSVKTTTTQERNFTLDELKKAKSGSEAALQSWQDAKAKAEENITLQTEQIALWQRLISETVKAGVVDKPTAEVNGEAIVK